ncbi:hypothetical protein OESDEN_21683 [Oesophagostomum dentatum]|uniref:Uncharacterized protein n=1 Tax=Oesophagostomum dentatum TaxID=61180 RepID=A0A0B1S193_OESDE|nr:hypothetical protein OESDEN_21683 [Oesophagostomum dentatum]
MPRYFGSRDPTPNLSDYSAWFFESRSPWSGFSDPATNSGERRFLLVLTAPMSPPPSSSPVGNSSPFAWNYSFSSIFFLVEPFHGSSVCFHSVNKRPLITRPVTLKKLVHEFHPEY